MKAFAFRTIQLKQPREQMQIIEDNATIAAFYRLDANRCTLATKSAHIANLMQKVVPKIVTRRQTRGKRSAGPVRGAVSTIVVLFSLRSPSSIALFADKIIEERIFSFIKRTFQVHTEITPSSNANQRVVKVTGHTSAIEQAREHLLHFPSLCQTKVFDHATSKTNSTR